MSAIKKRKVIKGQKEEKQSKFNEDSSDDKLLGSQHLKLPKKKKTVGRARHARPMFNQRRRGGSKKLVTIDTTKKGVGRTPSAAFSTPVRRSRNSNSDCQSDTSAFDTPSTTSVNSKKDDDNFQSVMAFMMVQSKSETEQKNQDIETRKEEMRMH